MVGSSAAASRGGTEMQSGGFEPLRGLGILRVRAVERATGYSRASLYRLEAQGKFPRRVKLGSGPRGAIGWRAVDVAAWVDERTAETWGERGGTLAEAAET